jgi:hypothetical protein
VVVDEIIEATVPALPLRHRLLDKAVVGQVTFEIVVASRSGRKLALRRFHIGKGNMCAGLDQILRDAQAHASRAGDIGDLSFETHELFSRLTNMSVI